MNNHKKEYQYHLNLINDQINEALFELNKYKPYPEKKEWHKTLISMSDKIKELIKEID